MKKVILAVIAATFLSSYAVADTRDGKRAFTLHQFDVALKEFTVAAEAGDTEAVYYLGLIHAGGYGVKQDLTKALDYYGQAARKGHVLAQKEYGTALAIGDGAEQNVEEGLKWLFIAARAGHDGARETATRFAKYMRNTVIITARRQAIDWKKDFDQKNGATQ